MSKGIEKFSDSERERIAHGFYRMLLLSGRGRFASSQTLMFLTRQSQRLVNHEGLIDYKWREAFPSLLHIAILQFVVHRHDLFHSALSVTLFTSTVTTIFGFRVDVA
jgi:hypothetical protein